MNPAKDTILVTGSSEALAKESSSTGKLFLKQLQQLLKACNDPSLSWNSSS
ncbi:unnamed protein product [Oikopleura dioica]|uniref:Uncharacterized protein n=1 Tax=Oikopleura dioica TaxID=34765 RepID=E4YPH4_OIKDI|nr:unnamed protein product [Oikopleura dioica]